MRPLALLSKVVKFGPQARALPWRVSARASNHAPTFSHLASRSGAAGSWKSIRLPVARGAWGRTAASDLYGKYGRAALVDALPLSSRRSACVDCVGHGWAPGMMQTHVPPTRRRPILQLEDETFPQSGFPFAVALAPVGFGSVLRNLRGRVSHGETKCSLRGRRALHCSAGP